MSVIVLPEGSTYAYWDQGSVDANWADSAYDDSAWKTGTAPLGYGDGYIVTTVGYGPSANNKFITTWFRATFDVQKASSVTMATLEIQRDDGARAFVNGVEAGRTNMPGGAIAANTLASNIIDGAQETVFVGLNVDPALLVDGQNVLAIEVHQAVANSSDLGIDARLTIEQQ